jgi:hypothetical protein
MTLSFASYQALNSVLKGYVVAFEKDMRWVRRPLKAIIENIREHGKTLKTIAENNSEPLKTVDFTKPLVS